MLVKELFEDTKIPQHYNGNEQFNLNNKNDYFFLTIIDGDHGGLYKTNLFFELKEDYKDFQSFVDEILENFPGIKDINFNKILINETNVVTQISSKEFEYTDIDSIEGKGLIFSDGDLNGPDFDTIYAQLNKEYQEYIDNIINSLKGSHELSTYPYNYYGVRESDF